MATSSGGSSCRRVGSRSRAASWPTAAWCSVCASCEDDRMTTEQQPQGARTEDQPIGSVSAPPAAEGSDAVAALPEDAVIILPVRNVVLYPGVMLPLSLGRPRSTAAAQEAARREQPLGVLLQRQAEAEDPGPDEMHSVGTIARILRYVTAPDGSHHIVC